MATAGLWNLKFLLMSRLSEMGVRRKRIVLVTVTASIIGLFLALCLFTPSTTTDTHFISGGNGNLPNPDIDHLPTQNLTVYTCSRPSSSSTIIKHDLKQIKGIFRRYVPKNFDPKYKNYCWRSQLKLSALPHTVPDLRQLYESHQLVDHQVNKLIQKAGGAVDGINGDTLTCIPSVFMAGFPKSGSTYIYKLLSQHPSISPGKVKEPHFWTSFPFQNENNYNKLAVLTYLANFKHASNCSSTDSDCVTIDASQSLIWNTRYTISDCTLPRVFRELFPNAKFIINMREPTSRTYSDFHSFSLNDCSQFFKSVLLSEVFDLKMKSETGHFSSCLQSHSLHYCTQESINYPAKVFKDCGEVRLGSSVYVSHIKRWLAFFPRDQFLFLRLDDVINDLYGTMKEIWSFLGVRVLSQEEFAELKKKVIRKPKEYNSMKDSTRQLLDDFFRPFNEELAETLGDNKFMWK
ncbi:PREDICTED: carbohydrate sulfotransferase 15-like [Amphimedon queenslandica]|uniref:Sulfotransferase domain-containing protein n=1 Tax=Amphimedon queenslandica TaxID=400682 RepID=A0A1X7TE07_AMPQE|nr:PREDICTED: carbohydrate sulfotransferase 15-like [Amphimedon queenslandica]|eukprot:XP_011407719.2 PREDICTED: carbohydrate sulfotransferase 15-like [Amphimedon queenslandica]